MIAEDESWKEQFSDNTEMSDREGHNPQTSSEGRSEKTGRRPRIQRQTYDRVSSGRDYVPRENRGYESRGNYSQRPDGSRGYQPRQEGGYQRREGSYQPRLEGGYRPRQEGGYQHREGGYQPRQEGGYQRREGSYQPRQEGGYRPRQEGGYQQRREGGYQPYGQQRRPFRPRNGFDPNEKYSQKKRIEYKELNFDPNEPVRLNRFLSNAGVCSRREADTFIQAGVVSVNGTVVTELGTKVLRSDEVRFHDQPVKMEKKVYVLLNKPKDYVTTVDDPQNRKTVMELVKNACTERIYPVGRLDRNTTGVLLLTNDGELASKLTHPQYKKKKVYHVFTDKNVTAADMRQIAEGIQLEDGVIKADAIEYASETDKKQVGIEIHSGRNRIVRRIFEHLGYRIIKLDRVYFAGLTKKNVKRGDWRYLTEKEVTMLRMGAFE
ncbi:MAG: RNA-binding S4 domain-containing protein [Prevotellaceae bacterium]|nr:RNA-binding S4 domain-containing protein [Prevotellaceae bacterium]